MPEIVSSLTAKYDKAETVELCGLILLDGTIVDCDNTHPEPTKGFRIPAKELVKYEDDLYGTWHTHPHDTANLSQTDYEGFNQWPRLRHFIIGIDGVRCFTVESGLIVEVAL
jgi:proteasome lid subunit RPN8/RPN11